MKNYLIYYLLILSSISINSCDGGSKEEYSNYSISLAETTGIATPNNDTTPEYSFSSTDSGTITYGGSCSSSTTSAISGNNTITLDSLENGTYADCTIKVSKRFNTNESESIISGSLTITSFTINTASVSTQMGGAIQGSELSLSTSVTTLAGSSQGYANATGSLAEFYGPAKITTDGTNLYVTDQYNHTIRKIVISTGVVTTLAGGGPGSQGYSNGTGTDAKFFSPTGITTDGTNLYVADSANNRIRKIVISTGVVTTLAGQAGPGSVNGTGTNASFNFSLGITTDGTNLYVADTNNNRIRKIVISTGVVTTLAGSSEGYANGTGTSAQFNNPGGITIVGTNLYVTDTYNHRIRKIVISTGVVTTLAGSDNDSIDGTGSLASINGPIGITTDGTNLYVGGFDGHRIRKIVISTGVVTTPAGSSAGYANGTSSSAQFNSPTGITTDGTNLYVADLLNNRIRKIE